MDSRSAALGLLAAFGAVALVSFLTGDTARMTRNGSKGPTPKQKVAAERRVAAARKRDAAAQTRAARERSRDARLVAVDRSRGANKVCKEARKRKARIRAQGKRARAALDERVTRALVRAGGRCGIARSERARARAILQERREALAAARGPRSMQLEHARRGRAAEKEQLLSSDAVSSALSADLAPALVEEAQRVWFTKSGRFRAAAREAAGRLSRAKLFEAFQEWIVENENDLWQRATERAGDLSFP